MSTLRAEWGMELNWTGLKQHTELREANSYEQTLANNGKNSYKWNLFFNSISRQWQ